jgi:hypothetical protein
MYASRRPALATVLFRQEARLIAVQESIRSTGGKEEKRPKPRNSEGCKPSLVGNNSRKQTTWSGARLTSFNRSWPGSVATSISRSHRWPGVSNTSFTPSSASPIPSWVTRRRSPAPPKRIRAKAPSQRSAADGGRAGDWRSKKPGKRPKVRAALFPLTATSIRTRRQQWPWFLKRMGRSLRRIGRSFLLLRKCASRSRQWLL